MSRASVLNVMDDLVRAGLIMRAYAGHGAARYETASDYHHHSVCDACGSVADVPCDSPPRCVDPVGVGRKVEGAQVVFGGFCVECLSSGAGKTSGKLR